MFSFFGEEFHPDDRPRFRDELAARGADVTRLGQPDLADFRAGKQDYVLTDLAECQRDLARFAGDPAQRLSVGHPG